MRRLELLGILFWVSGGLHLAAALLFAVVGVLGGLGLIDPSDPLQERIGGFVGTAILGLAAGGLGIAHVVAATGLRRQRPWARTTGLVLGVLDVLCCCAAPLSTVVGIFALVVLLSDEVVALFPSR